MSIKKDKYYISLANNLANNSNGYTGPNPSVGAVVVKNDQVISFGSTSITGRPHAEINALNKLSKNEKQNSTIYISLEPCAHYGKTAPCVNEIINSGVKRVVYSSTDLDTRTSGKSFNILKSKNINVKKNLLSTHSQKIYKKYFYSIKKNKPYVIGKLAISRDFFSKDNNNFYITNRHSLNTAHILRSKTNCILTTSKTINDDNPKLNCRINGLYNLSPNVVILDKSLKIKLKSYLVNNAKNNKTYLFYNTINIKKLKLLKSKKVQLIYTPIKEKNLNFDFILRKLSTLEVSSILIEGGKTLIASLLKRNYFNEFYLFISSKSLKKGGSLKFKNIKSKLYSKFKNIKYKETFLDKDSLIHYY